MTYKHRYMADKSIKVANRHHDFHWTIKPFDEEGVSVHYADQSGSGVTQKLEVVDPEAAILIGRAMMEVANAQIETMKRLQVKNDD